MQTLRTLFYLLLDPQSLEPCLVLAGTWCLLWIIMIFVWIWLEKLWLLHDLSRKPATPMLISIQFYKCLLVLCYIPRRLCVGLWLFTPGYTGQILVENGLNSSLPLRFFSKVPGLPSYVQGLVQHSLPMKLIQFFCQSACSLLSWIIPLEEEPHFAPIQVTHRRVSVTWVSPKFSHLCLTFSLSPSSNVSLASGYSILPASKLPPGGV